MNNRGALGISKDIRKAIDDASNGDQAATEIFSAMCWVAVMDGKIDEGEINLLKQFGNHLWN